MGVLGETGQSCAHAIEQNPHIKDQLVNITMSHTPNELMGHNFSGTEIEQWYRMRILPQLKIVKDSLWNNYGQTENPNDALLLITFVFHVFDHVTSQINFDYNRLVLQEIVPEEEFVGELSNLFEARIVELTKCRKIAENVTSNSEIMKTIDKWLEFCKVALQDKLLRHELLE